MRYFYTILISSLFVLCCMLTSKSEVITLTAETFNDKISEKHTAWFVKFCVPWCKHWHLYTSVKRFSVSLILFFLFFFKSKNLGKLWEDLGKAIEGEDSIEIGEVDCGTTKSICQKVDIHSYPTFKLFYNGEEAAKYQGPRDVESLKLFALEETEKAERKAEGDEDKEL
ncbi:unnamed protein product [Cuscuta epithymum]|uniref:Thioredoxin domain-containing protein n=1 Tax=Cuscuta epithymum TaxID=186058 RepID=A0AAV0DYD6_9ASTE|nr:unnamed protein product [Cuscuta epithymum]